MEQEEQNPKGKTKKLILIATAILAVAIVAIAILLSFKPAGEKVEEVTIRGITYTTNLELEEYGGHVYAYVYVNSKPDEIILTVESNENYKIQNYINFMDTLIPGEHVIEMDDYELHIIVDGIKGEN